MKTKHIVIAVIVLAAAGAGFYLWRRKKAADQAGPTNGTAPKPAKKLPPVKAPPGVPISSAEALIQDFAAAPKLSVVSRAASVAGNVTSAVCERAGGGPLCGAAGKTAQVTTKVLGKTTQVAAKATATAGKAVGKATASVAKKLKFW